MMTLLAGALELGRSDEVGDSMKKRNEEALLK